MADIETLQNRKRLPTGTGIEPLSGADLGAATAPQRALGRLADVGGAFAAQTGRNIFRAEAKAQTIKGIAAVKSSMLAEFDTYDTNADHTTYRKSFDKMVTGLGKIPAGLSNGLARKEVEQFITANKPVWENNLNDAVTNRTKINIEATAVQNIEGIKDLDLTNIDGVLEAENIVGQSGDLLTSIGYTPKQVENWMAEELRVVENQTISQQANAISLSKGYQKAVDFVMKSKLEQPDKERIVNDIKFNASQQKLAFEQGQEKAERGYLNNLEKESLSSDQVLADLNRNIIDTDTARDWLKMIDAQSEERLSGKVPTDAKYFKTYDSLVGMIDDYSNDFRDDKDVINKAISDAAGVTIPVSGEGSAISLRTKLSSADDVKEPTNRSSFKRGESFLKDLTTQQFFLPKGSEKFADNSKELREAIRQNNLTGLRLNDEYVRWIESQEKEPTDEQITEKINELTQPFIEEKALSTADKIFNFASFFSPFGAQFRALKKGVKVKEPTGVRIEIERDGQRFTIPEGQLAEAEKQGYRRIQ